MLRECCDVRIVDSPRIACFIAFTDRRAPRRHVNIRIGCQQLERVVDAAAKVDRVRVRCGRIEDASSIARISEQAFGLNSQSLQSLQSLGRVGQLIAAAADASDVGNQIVRTLKDKKLAHEEARTFTLQLQARMMRAELAAIQQGRQSSSLLQLSPVDRASIQRWRRRRMCNCFVAEDEASGNMVGCAFVSFLAPEALLPPPWPTLKPTRLYISNMAVSPDYRRRGAAKALLQACERLGRRWGQSSVWLHTEASNEAANALYQSSGYELHSERPLLPFADVLGVGRDRLYTKALTPSRCGSRQVAVGKSGGSSVGGSVRSSDNVFVWERTNDGNIR